MNIIEIQEAFKVMTPKIKELLDYKLNGVTPFYGKKYYDERFLGNDQETQDCTKDFQYIANVAIEEAAKECGYPLEQKEVDGADWVYNGLAIEQKIRSFLLRSENKDKFNKPWCKIGDWVMFARYAGARLPIEGGEVRILNDDEVLGTIGDPESVLHYI